MTTTFFQFYKIAIFSVAAFVFPVAAEAQQVSARQVAGLIEDVSALRAEVRRLRAEVEELRTENARLLDKANSAQSSGTQSAAAFASFRVEMNGKFEAQRKEIAADTDKKIRALANEMNIALTDFRKQVNTALGNAGGKPPKAPGAPIAKPKDLPDVGITYKVKPGDTLSKIATENSSKIQWIIYANEGLNPNKITVGMEIVVPVKK